jgi:hypothetical protein
MVSEHPTCLCSMSDRLDRTIEEFLEAELSVPLA